MIKMSTTLWFRDKPRMYSQYLYTLSEPVPHPPQLRSLFLLLVLFLRPRGYQIGGGGQPGDHRNVLRSCPTSRLLSAADKDL